MSWALIDMSSNPPIFNTISVLMFLKRKYRVTVINPDWTELTRLKLKSIPNANEFLYLTDLGGYYRVVNVVHQIIEGKHIHILIVEKVAQKPM